MASHLLSSILSDSALREASAAAAAVFKDFEAETLVRNDPFNLIDMVLRKCEPLDCESQRFLEKKHYAYLLNGLLLAESSRQRFRIIQSSICASQDDFYEEFRELAPRGPA